MHACPIPYVKELVMAPLPLLVVACALLPCGLTGGGGEVEQQQISLIILLSIHTSSVETCARPLPPPPPPPPPRAAVAFANAQKKKSQVRQLSLLFTYWVNNLNNFSKLACTQI